MDEIDKLDEQIDSISNEEMKEEKAIKIEKLPEQEIVEEKDIDEKIDDPKEEFTSKKVEEKSPKKKKKITDYLIWILIGLAVVVTIILKLLLCSGKKEKVLTEAEKKQLIKEYGEKLEEAIDTYFQQYDLLLTYEDATKMIDFSHTIECSEHKVYKDGKIYIADCSIDREDVLYTYGTLKQEDDEEEIEYDDAEKRKIYVSKENHKATLSEPSNLNNYDVYEFELKERYTNLGLLGESNDYVYYHTDDGNNHLYNYKKNEELKPSDNTADILPIRFDNQYDQEYVVVVDKQKSDDSRYHNIKYGIYHLKNKKFSINLGTYSYGGSNQTRYTGHGGAITFDILALDDGILYAGKNGKDGVINYRTGEEIIPTNYFAFVSKDGYLLANSGDYNKKNYQIFDTKGNELLKGKYDVIYVMYSKDYILIKQGKDTKLININGEELYNYHEANQVTLNYNSFTDENGVYFQFDRDYVMDAVKDYCTQFSYNYNTKEGSVDTVECKIKRIG